eukprot:2990294-Pleurochrysis_carterae.AAC.1
MAIMIYTISYETVYLNEFLFNTGGVGGDARARSEGASGVLGGAACGGARGDRAGGGRTDAAPA